MNTVKKALIILLIIFIIIAIAFILTHPDAIPKLGPWQREIEKLTPKWGT